MTETTDKRRFASDLTGRAGQLRKSRDEALASAETAITGLDELDVTTTAQATAANAQKGATAKDKLAAARQFGESMQKDLRETCRGLEDTIGAIGFQVAESANFQGMGEKSFAFLGRMGITSALEKAQSLRLKRLENQDLGESVKQIARLVQTTISELATIESDYTDDVKAYSATLIKVLAKLKEGQPKFAAVKSKREELEGQVITAKLELESGTVSEADRPAAEAEYERLQAELNKAKLTEVDLLGVIKNAQEHIPILQQNRNAAEQAIQAIHQSRRNLLEKFQNLKVLLEQAMTALRAQARLELYKNIDPAMNKTVTLVTQHNIKVAAAAMEVAAERAAQKTINPEAYTKAEKELVDAVLKYADDVANLEEEFRRGPRVPDGTPVPVDDDSGGGPSDGPAATAL